MTSKYNPHLIVEVALLFIALAGLPAGGANADKESPYLKAVREFADNVLKYGRDTYGPKHTPLFVDGLNIHNHEPVKWIAPNGDRWILSNLASQQNLFRVLDGLTKITGDPKYRQAAMEAIEYAFANLRSPNGLLYWGHFVAYDAKRDNICEGGLRSHVLKWHYPYYELMWEVDLEATKTFVEAFWSAHIIDWSNLDMDRISHFNEFLEEPWHCEYKGGSTFFKSKRGNVSAQLPTGTSLIYAGTVLHKLLGQQKPLVWSKRLAKRYVDTRHPKTGISKIFYNNDWLQLGDDLKEHFLDPFTTIFPCCPFAYPYLQYPENNILEAYPWMSVFLVGEMLGEDGKEFTQWALEELTAWGKASYRKKDNSFVPILTDGTNIEGYVWKEGPYGLNVAKACLADASTFWLYSVAYRTTRDEFMWEMARDIALGNHLGDIGQTPAHIPELRTETTCSNVYGLMGFLELYARTKKPAYLEMSRSIGDNILSSQFHKGFFMPSKRHIYTRFDCFEPLALLHLDAAMNSKIGSAPCVWPNVPIIIPPYRYKQMGVDRRVIYALTESDEPPLSLQEAAAIGDVNLVRTLIEEGTDVDSLEDSYLKTALHRAVMSGHKDVVELLLVKGAHVDGGASGLGVRTPLDYAAEKGHKEIAELLIAKGADVNAKNNEGRTPVDVALSRNRSEVVKLLIEKGADVSNIYLAAYLGDVAKVMSFIEQGSDVNTKHQGGGTPLHYAAMAGSKEVSELLLARGADIKAKDRNGATPLHWGSAEGHRDLAEFLITKGADIDARDDTWSETPLHYAAYRGHKAVVELLIAKGANIHLKDKDGYTPLHWAVHAGHRDVAELLIAKGADVNAKENDGKTPLQIAKDKGHTEIVELLRKHGAKEDKAPESSPKEEKPSDPNDVELDDIDIIGKAESSKLGAPDPSQFPGGLKPENTNRGQWPFMIPFLMLIIPGLRQSASGVRGGANVAKGIEPRAKSTPMARFSGRIVLPEGTNLAVPHSFPISGKGNLPGQVLATVGNHWAHKKDGSLNWWGRTIAAIASLIGVRGRTEQAKSIEHSAKSRGIWRTAESS